VIELGCGNQTKITWLDAPCYLEVGYVWQFVHPVAPVLQKVLKDFFIPCDLFLAEPLQNGFGKEYNWGKKTERVVYAADHLCLVSLSWKF